MSTSRTRETFRNPFRTPPLLSHTQFQHGSIGVQRAAAAAAAAAVTVAAIPSPPVTILPLRNALQPPPPSLHPQFRSKSVCKLFCKHCDEQVCNRGMKAILLGDTRVELYSTDAPPVGVQLVEKDYMTRNCQCKIRDVACLQCGSVIGYHVTQPCEICLDSCNNGHFWMFLSDGVTSKDRSLGDKKLLWAQLPCAEYDVELPMSYELLCR